MDEETPFGSLGRDSVLHERLGADGISSPALRCLGPSEPWPQKSLRSGRATVSRTKLSAVDSPPWNPASGDRFLFVHPLYPQKPIAPVTETDDRNLAI